MYGIMIWSLYWIFYIDDLQMSVNRVLHFSFQSILFFLFIALFHWRESPVQLWIQMIRTDILAFSDFRRKAFSLSPIKYEVTWGLYWETVLLFPVFWKFFLNYYLIWISGFAKFFYTSTEMTIFHFMIFKCSANITLLE